jgi:hypothetical protein
MTRSPVSPATGSGSRSAPGPTLARTPGTSLEWLNDILWPNGDGSFVAGVSGGQAPSVSTAAAGVEPSWWANPTAAAAQTLMPATPIAAARRAVRRYHDGQSLPRRARSVAAEVAMRSGPLRSVLPLGEVVGLRGSLDTGVIGRLRRELAEPDLTVAVSLAQPKSNRKPVLQLLRADGHCIGFAKVASTDHTRVLVENEAAWLRRRPRVPLASPDLLWSGEAEGAAVLVMSAVLPPRIPRRRPTAPPPAAVFSAVADLGTRRTILVLESGWWSRVERLAAVASADELTAIQRVGATAEDRPLPVGGWHGDLAPWNLLTRQGAYHLIDWEFAADDVPVGFDLCHFHLQAGNETLGLHAGAALTRARDLALGHLGADGALVFSLYLVELLRRQLHLRSIGYPEEGITHGPAALALLQGGTA